MSIHIVLADDHEIAREGLYSLLAQQPDMEVVAQAGDGRSAVKLACELSPEVVIMDIGMPDLNGIEATRQIRAKSADIKVVALSMHSDKRFVTGMLQAGASAYLLKKGAFSELVHAIRCVVASQTYLSPKIAGAVIGDYLERLSADVPGSVLTPKEREVLQLLVEGKTTQQIAEQLYVSINTVGTHRQHLMEKLGVNNVADLTKYALREGLTSLEP